MGFWGMGTTLGDLEALSLANGFGKSATVMRMGAGDKVSVRTTFLGCSGLAASWGELVGDSWGDRADGCGVTSLSEARVELQAATVVSSSSSKKRMVMAAIC